jgi:hypothetical protein
VSTRVDVEEIQTTKGEKLVPVLACRLDLIDVLFRRLPGGQTFLDGR